MRGTGKRAGVKPPLPLGCWWVDEKGDLHDAENIDCSLDSLLFRHFGQVKLTVNDHEIYIHWDTDSVTGDALPSVLDRLFRCCKNRKIRLNFYYFGWVREAYDHPSAAMSRIFEIQQCQRVDHIHSSLMNSQNIADIERASPLLKRSFKLWEQTKGRFGDVPQDTFSNFLPRILIFRPDRNEENILFTWVGMKTVAVKTYGRTWAQKSIGQVSNKSIGLESQFHADKVSTGIAKTLKTGEPNLDHFRVLVDKDNQEPFWVSYERLLTHHMLHDGKPGIVCTVSESQDVTIPLAGGFQRSAGAT
jgi:hypothetical protein